MNPFTYLSLGYGVCARADRQSQNCQDIGLTIPPNKYPLLVMLPGTGRSPRGDARKMMAS